MNRSRASCTSFSDSESSALVASSRSRIAGFFNIALAMAIRCFWPPESCSPLSPTYTVKHINSVRDETGFLLP
ncbi:hypothetical protein MUK42_36061 [Musa troglodytarum]|uniref:Uncharacterized protein n=1 Tax=Musa troglodytarum TaxID=320322 RepID=A0A9E7FJ32_9LILI|nr:hypothetical protein MUK42_36061 [Musa troglodytarum]